MDKRRILRWAKLVLVAVSSPIYALAIGFSGWWLDYLCGYQDSVIITPGCFVVSLSGVLYFCFLHLIELDEKKVVPPTYVADMEEHLNDWTDDMAAFRQRLIQPPFRYPFQEYFPLVDVCNASQEDVDWVKEGF